MKRRAFFRSVLGAIASLAIAQSIALEPVLVRVNEGWAKIEEIWMRHAHGGYFHIILAGDKQIHCRHHEELPFTIA